MRGRRSMLLLLALACVREGRPAAPASAVAPGVAEVQLTGMLNGGCIAEVAHPVVEGDGDGRRLAGVYHVLLQNNIRLHLRWGGPTRKGRRRPLIAVPPADAALPSGAFSL